MFDVAVPPSGLEYYISFIERASDLPCSRITGRVVDLVMKFVPKQAL